MKNIKKSFTILTSTNRETSSNSEWSEKIYIKTNMKTQVYKEKFRKLRDSYLTIYFLATFANWLQGPYIYKVYSDSGWSDSSIAYFYVAKYVTNCMFGLVVGHLADRCGRKILCTLYTVFFTICCLTKLSSNFYILILGKAFGGISTSILYTVFEVWYLNEHINYYNFPVDWLNLTFSKATLYNGISAILAGLTGQILVEYFGFSPLLTSLLAVPILLVTFVKIKNWKEHTMKRIYCNHNNNTEKKSISQILSLIYNNKALLLLGVIQCLSETVTYVFIFSWTPILSSLGLPLGLVFTSFMIALMLGSHLYKTLISKNIRPQELLTFSIFLATTSFLILQVCLKQIQNGSNSIKLLSYLCLMSFILYEFSLGLHHPSLSFLRGQIAPQEYRATLINCFRVPTNVITCVCLILTDGSKDFKSLYKSQILILISSFILLSTLFLSYLFSKKYSSKVVKMNKAIS